YELRYINKDHSSITDSVEMLFFGANIFHTRKAINSNGGYGATVRCRASVSGSEHTLCQAKWFNPFPLESCRRASMADQLPECKTGAMMNIRIAITLLLGAVIPAGQAQGSTKIWDGFVTDT